MNTGFGQNLEGFLIKGNLSLAQAEIPLIQGDGSIEASGTLYVNNVQEYFVDEGVTIQGVSLRGGVVSIPYNASSSNASTGSVVCAGGVSISHDTNATSVTAGGALTVDGGASIAKRLYVGGEVNVGGNKVRDLDFPELPLDAVNKAYVDSVASKVSGNFTTGQVIVADSEGDAIKGYDSLRYDGSVLTLSHTASSSLVSLGGATLGDVLDMGGNRVIGVASPVLPTDGVNKDYIDNKTFGNLLGSFGENQLLVGGTSSNSVISSSLLTFDGQQLVIRALTEATSVTAPASLVTYGGAVVGGTLIVGDGIDLNGTVVSNGSDPTQPTDLATKAYVDAQGVRGNFTAGQVIIAGGEGDERSVRGYGGLTYDGTTLIAGEIRINTTTSNSLTVDGGVFIGGNVSILGSVDMNGSMITGVTMPTLALDVANKAYVDAHRLRGNFTTGQLIVADSVGDAIRGYDTLAYDSFSRTFNVGLGSSVYLFDTSDSVGLGSGGTLTTFGGASFEKSVYIGGQLDVNIQRITNVATPIDNFDAANKAYVDGLVANLGTGTPGGGNTGFDTGFEQTYTLSNNVLFPEDILGFNYSSSDVKAFIAHVYVHHDNQEAALYVLYGVNTNGLWTLTSSFAGQPTGVRFFIRNEVGTGIIQYVNENPFGITIIKFRTVVQVDTVAGSGQINRVLDNNTLIPTDIPPLTYLNQDVHAVKLLIHVTITGDTERNAFFQLNCLLKNDVWVVNSSYEGDDTGVTFIVASFNSLGKVQFTNNNLTGTCLIRVKQIKIFNYQIPVTLAMNTTAPAAIPSSQLTFGNKDETNFSLMAYVDVPGADKYALYEIHGMLVNSIWRINTRLIGDMTGVQFYITTTYGVGTLQYTNVNADLDARIKLVIKTPSVFLPLAVDKGGTGNTSLYPTAVLRGNGIDPIVGTSDFVYEDNRLILGQVSQILLTNTDGAVNLTTGGTLTTYGGVAIGKNLLVGDTLQVAGVDVTPSIGDLSERTFFADNVQSVPAPVVGLSFGSGVKAFKALVAVTIETSVDQYDALFELKGIRSRAGWKMGSSYFGDATGIQLSIHSSGQVQYTSTGLSHWSYTLMKFRAFTCSVGS